MHRDKAVRYRSKEKGGDHNARLSLKNKQFRVNAVSKSFSTGTILGLTSKKPKSKAYTENTTKTLIF